uniref:Sugar phosphate transporter domain-containing protein n=1 Tax=Mucochytrium quahogii TaxID=96639 RepID=A0A7S2WUA7_9STRA|mmetsp:Transcript_9329/g.15191  ORF Transcript_9329/g.15191 Transcript_9329/m.15191 type:complete len:320 (+) Transcript_9329:170-1129(+)
MGFSVKSLATCAAYMVVGPTLMIVNKNIMDKEGINFGYPFLLSSLGLIFTGTLAHVMRFMGMLELPHGHLVTKKFWIRNIFPVGACHAATLSFGNAQYMFMGVALIQFLKAFTPMVVNVFVYVLLGKTKSQKVWLALLIACFGTSMTAVGNMSLNMFGLLLAAGSSSTEAIRLVLTQYALQDCKFTLMEGQYFLAPVGAFCLLALSFLFEGNRLLETGDLGKMVANPTSFFFAGSLGFGVQMLTAGVIQLTNSITLKILSQLRNSLVVLSGVLIYGEVITFGQFCGYLVSICGIVWYSWLEQQKQQAPTLPVKSTENEK